MKTLLLTLGLILVIAVGAVWLQAAPQTQTSNPQAWPALPARSSAAAATSTTPLVGTPTSTPTMIVVKTPTTVTVTVAITPLPILNGVNLLRVGATGTQSTILGVMHDDGKNGDAVAGDGIYTLQVPFNEQSAGQIQLQVSAAFQGRLQRVLSSVLSLGVWNFFTTSTSSLPASFIYPPTWTAISPPAAPDSGIDVCPPGDDLCSSGLTINAVTGSLDTELADLTTGVQLDSQSTVTIHNLQWTVAITSDTDAGQQSITALAQNGTLVYSVSGVYYPSLLPILNTVLSSIY